MTQEQTKQWEQDVRWRLVDALIRETDRPLERQEEILAMANTLSEWVLR